MSRYSINARNPQLQVVVGWDDGLKTFFGQVLDPRLDEEHEMLIWIGASSREIVNIVKLADALKSYADIPPEVRTNLARDFSAHGIPPTNPLVS
jgi:hypothetical protein